MMTVNDIVVKYKNNSFFKKNPKVFTKLIKFLNVFLKSDDISDKLYSISTDTISSNELIDSLKTKHNDVYNWLGQFYNADTSLYDTIILIINDIYRLPVSKCQTQQQNNTKSPIMTVKFLNSGIIEI